MAMVECVAYNHLASAVAHPTHPAMEIGASLEALRVHVGIQNWERAVRDIFHLLLYTHCIASLQYRQSGWFYLYHSQDVRSRRGIQGVFLFLLE